MTEQEFSLVEKLSHAVWRLADRNRKRHILPLTKESVVVDAGGYVGEWSETIFEWYHCKIILFEPQPKYAAMCRIRFEKNPRITVREEALGIDDRQIGMSEGVGGTVGEGNVLVRQVDVATALPKRVDLIKMNIEGAEYEILERLHETGRLRDVNMILVQFHKRPKGSYERMKTILAPTHRRLWRYPGVWEMWALR